MVNRSKGVLVVAGPRARLASVYVVPAHTLYERGSRRRALFLNHRPTIRSIQPEKGLPKPHGTATQ
jgi:hypothetical protein